MHRSLTLPARRQVRCQSRYINSFKFSAIRQNVLQRRVRRHAVLLLQRVDQVQAAAHLLVGRRPRRDQVQPQPHLPAHVRPRLLPQPLREQRRLLVGELAVEQRQRLRRLRRGEAHRRRAIRLGQVEVLQDRHQQRPLDVDVDAPPGLLLRRRLAPAVARHRLPSPAPPSAGPGRRRGRTSSGSGCRSPPGSNRGSPRPSAAACRSARTGRSPGRPSAPRRCPATTCGRRWTAGSSGAAASAAIRRSTNSDASQSSNSGCVGLSPCRPKLFGERTMPRPKWYCQRRLAITRAASGLSFDDDPVRQGQPPAARLRVLRPAPG